MSLTLCKHGFSTLEEARNFSIKLTKAAELTSVQIYLRDEEKPETFPPTGQNTSPDSFFCERYDSRTLEIKASGNLLIRSSSLVVLEEVSTTHLPLSFEFLSSIPPWTQRFCIYQKKTQKDDLFTTPKTNNSTKGSKNVWRNDLMGFRVFLEDSTARNGDEALTWRVKFRVNGRDE